MLLYIYIIYKMKISAYFRLKQFDISFICKNPNFQLFMLKTNIYIRPLLESNTQLCVLDIGQRWTYTA